MASVIITTVETISSPIATINDQTDLENCIKYEINANSYAHTVHFEYFISPDNSEYHVRVFSIKEHVNKTFPICEFSIPLEQVFEEPSDSQYYLYRTILLKNAINYVKSNHVLLRERLCSDSSLVDVCEFENKIKSIINDNTHDVHFNYKFDRSTNKFGVQVYTIKKYSRTSFLLHEEYETVSPDYENQELNIKVRVLQKVIDYLKKVENPTEEINYIITWYHTSQPNDIKTSWFFATTFTDIVRKFFYGKNEHDYVIVKAERKIVDNGIMG
jgi:hypothetical protein